MKRTTSPGHVGNLFTDGSPPTTPPTTVGASDVNTLQEELVNLVEGSGQSLDPLDDTQVYKAVQALAASPQAYKNPVINADMNVWQRTVGVSNQTTSQYVADRWLCDPGDSGRMSITRNAFTVGITVPPHNPRWSTKWDQNIAATVTRRPTLVQRIESVRTFAGFAVVASFYGRSQSPSTLNVTLKLRQNFGTGGSAEVELASSTITLDGTWTLKQAQFTLGSLSGKTIGGAADDYLELVLEFPDSLTYDARLWGFQLELGGAASSFERLPEEVNRLRAYRYYQKSFRETDAPGSASTQIAAGFGYETGDVCYAAAVNFPVEMRANPTMAWYSTNIATVARVRWNAADLTVVSTNNRSTASTGYPQVTAATGPATLERFEAHWTADAEL